MGYLFLDIESFVDPKNERSGLNPFFEKSKVIVISYNYYNSKKAPLTGKIKKPIFLCEWIEGSEKQLLEKFYLFLKEIYEKEKFLKIIGFNQLAYDLPYLFERMRKNSIGNEKQLFDMLFTNVRHVDLAQLAMSVSENTKRNEDFRCISQKAINEQFQIPIKCDDGKVLSKYYLSKDYDKILKYVEEEFTFELLYLCLIEYFICL
jgi:hypothetical protein